MVCPRVFESNDHFYQFFGMSESRLRSLHCKKTPFPTPGGNGASKNDNIYITNTQAAAEAGPGRAGRDSPARASAWAASAAWQAAAAP